MEKRLKNKYDILKQKIYIIIYGYNTFAGKLFDLILLGVILLSVLIVMLESVEQLDSKYHNFLVISEWIITVFFTIEYILRIICIKKPIKFIFSFYGLVDLISILPMYLSFFIPGAEILSVFRALRLLRLFGVLRLMHYVGEASHLKLALIESRTKISVFIYFIVIVSVLLGAIMYLIEGKESGFTSIPTSIYWCIVTLTTVGYGDVAPITPLGKAIASFIMIMGYGIIAVPTGIITAEYSNIKKNTGQIIKKLNCSRCNSKIIEENANYCHNCGKKLNYDNHQ